MTHKGPAICAGVSAKFHLSEGIGGERATTGARVAQKLEDATVHLEESPFSCGRRVRELER